MMFLQAVPPVPPPFDPNLLFLNADPGAVVMIVLAVMVAATVILWPIVRALARRLEGRGTPDAALRAEVEQLHHRLADLESGQGRLAELEERLDFTERLLAQSREQDRLPR